MKINTANLSALDRSNGIEAYLSTIKEINDTTLPSLKGFVDLLKLDKQSQKMTQAFDRVFEGKSGTNWAQRSIEVLEKHVKKESSFEDLINEVVPKSMEIEEVDSRSAQIAAYINNLSFFSEMIRKITIIELDRIAKAKGQQVTSPFTPAETKEINAEFNAVLSTYRQLRATADLNFSKAIFDIPEFSVVAVDESVIAATYGKTNVTPLAQNFFSASLNPILAIRSLLNQRLIKRYHAAKEQRQILEYRIQALKDSLEGTSNPKLEKVIEYHTGELKRIQLELTRIEEKAR